MGDLCKDEKGCPGIRKLTLEGATLGEPLAFVSIFITQRPPIAIGDIELKGIPSGQCKNSPPGNWPTSAAPPA